jgi:hypothetical protein
VFGDPRQRDEIDVRFRPRPDDPRKPSEPIHAGDRRRRWIRRIVMLAVLLIAVTVVLILA